MISDAEAERLSAEQERLAREEEERTAEAEPPEPTLADDLPKVSDTPPRCLVARVLTPKGVIWNRRFYAGPPNAFLPGKILGPITETSASGIRQGVERGVLEVEVASLLDVSSGIDPSALPSDYVCPDVGHDNPPPPKPVDAAKARPGTPIFAKIKKRALALTLEGDPTPLATAAREYNERQLRRWEEACRKYPEDYAWLQRRIAQRAAAAAEEARRQIALAEKLKDMAEEAAQIASPEALERQGAAAAKNWAHYREALRTRDLMRKYDGVRHEPRHDAKRAQLLEKLWAAIVAAYDDGDFAKVRGLLDQYLATADAPVNAPNPEGKMPGGVY